MTAGWAGRVWTSEGAALRLPAWLVVAPVAGIGIVLLGTSGLYFSPPGSSVASWWPAAGLSFALAVVTPKRLIWATALIIFVSVWIGNAEGGHGLALSLWYAVGNVLEAGVGVAVLTSWFRRPALLVTLEDTARLLMAALAASATLGVFGAAGIALLNDGNFLRSAQSLTTSHMAALLIVANVA